MTGKNMLLALALAGIGLAEGYDFKIEKNISYHTEQTLAREGAYARDRCLLDVRWPVGVTNFATVVNIHGGGLVAGNRHFAPWPEEAKNLDPVAGVSVGYRLITNATPEQCIGDAAAAVAWTLDNIARYGGDPKKVVVTGISGGGYLTAMIGMDPKWLAKWGHRPLDLAGIVPLTGQVTKHFNVRAVSFRDTEPRYAPKVDEWAPLFWVKEPKLPPSLFLTGGRHDNEMPSRVEENELLGISLRNCGHRNASFIETEGSHGGSVEPSSRHLRDFVMRWCEAGGVGRLADGERVVFLGDSITHGGWFVADLQLFQDLRHPGSGTRIMNAGISGDTAAGGNARLRDDVLALKPDRVFVMFGMNDVGRHLYAEAEAKSGQEAAGRRRALEGYAAQQRLLARRLSEAGVKTVFMTPSPYDQYADAPAENQKGCNEPGLAACAARVREIARENGFGLIELHATLTEIFRRNPTAHFCGDRVHPGAWGHLLMAAQILDQMRVTPLVAQVSLDARTGRVLPRANGERRPETRNAVVTAVRGGTNGVAFTYAPKALPLPVTADYLQAERYYPLTARLNQERFVIAGLAAGTYDLAFDGTVVGRFTAEQFAAGVNVAPLATPNQRRAQALASRVGKLRDIADRRRLLELNRIRIRAHGVDPKNTAAAQACLDKWLAQPEVAKSPWAGAFRRWVEGYRTWAPREAELLAAEEDVREEMGAVRPACSRVTLVPRKK